jgi:hypothetical protein
VWANPNAPSLADYTLFVYDVAGVSPAYLPSSSPFLQYALNRALNIVLNIPSGLSGLEYTLAVYNCAFHIQLKITPDQVVNGVAYTYFLAKRQEFQLLQPVVGLVASSSDEGTSVTNAVPDALAQLTVTDLDFMKTHWGRDYLSFAQDFGGIWGLS